MNRKQLPYPLLVTVSHKGQTAFQKTFTDLPIVIGRSNNCDIPLTTFDFLSRQHCAINMENGVLEITDLDSSNGVYFEGKKVKKVQVSTLTQITIGDIQVKVEPIEAKEEQPTIVTDSGSEKTVIKDSTFLEQLDALEESEQEEIPKLSPPEEKKPSSRIPFGAVPKTSEELPNPVQFSEAKISNKPDVKREISKKTLSPKALTPHPQAAQLRPQQRVLESYITWKDQIYDLHQFYAGDQVIVGPNEHATVDLPVLKRNYKMAKFDGMNTQVYIPQNLRFELENEENSYSFEEAAFSPSVSRKKNYYTLKLGPSELVSIQITPDVSFHLRYAPAPRQLSSKIRLIKDEEMKIPGVVIGALEIFIFMLIFFTKTKEFDTPQKIMQKRVAKLIVEQKPPPPPPPEPKKPEPPPEKKVAKKQPTPRKQPVKVVKKQPRPKKIVKISKSKRMAKVNKYPVEVEKPLRPANKPVVTNIKAVGALAALGAVSSKAPPSAVPVAININKNAGGQTALNTGGVIGTLKTKTGKLAAGGMAQVKTKGLGYGTGTGYGVQGIKGTAGSRAVAGTVVGAPALVNLSKEDGLSRAQVMDVVKRYMTQIQQCYERSLIDNPNLVGRVEYEWEIVPKGSVKWAKVKKSDIAGGDSLNRCVTGIFKKMKFPVAKNGQNTIPNIGFPFGRL